MQVKPKTTQATEQTGGRPPLTVVPKTETAAITVTNLGNEKRFRLRKDYATFFEARGSDFSKTFVSRAPAEAPEPRRYGLIKNNPVGQKLDMATITREELDAKLERTEARVEAVEARIDTSLERLAGEVSSFKGEISGELSGLKTELSHKPSTSYMLTSAIASTVALAGFLVAILSFGADRFDGGVQVSGVSVEQAIEAKRIAQESDRKIDAMIARFDTVLERLEEDARTK